MNSSSNSSTSRASSLSVDPVIQEHNTWFGQIYSSVNFMELENWSFDAKQWIDSCEKSVLSHIRKNGLKLIDLLDQLDKYKRNGEGNSTTLFDLCNKISKMKNWGSQDAKNNVSFVLSSVRRMIDAASKHSGNR